MSCRSLPEPLLALVVFMGMFMAACGPIEDDGGSVESEESAELLTLAQEVRRYSDVQATVRNGNFCQVSVKRFGQLDLEETYLPKVVWCENREAPERSFEALKAQAIAARTYAFYRTYDYTGPGALDPGNGGASQKDQSYDCGTPSGESWDRAQRAVAATKGQVFINNATGHIVWGCYASGANRNLDDPSCRATSSHYTERHMTRNQGKAWGSPGFQQTTLGGARPGSTQYNNHGCMGQKEANCLASARSMDAEEILRYFYGDIRLVTLNAPCFAGGPTASPTRPARAGRTPSTGGPTQQQCRSNSEKPSITTRQQWGARSYRGAPASLGTPTRITIHHEGASAARTSGGARNVRGIQDSHMDGNGWDDVGYHYLIMPDGQIYQGRAEYRAGQLALGAHAGGANTGNIGIMLYGNFFLQQPSDAQMASVAQLVGWLSSTYNITPNVGSTLFGHRDVTSTSCPGDNLYNRLSEIAQAATSERVCSPGTGSGSSSGGDARPFLPTPDVDIPSTTYAALRLDSTGSEPFKLDALEIEGDDGLPIPFDIIDATNGETLTVADNTGCDTPNAVYAIPPGGKVLVLLSGSVNPGDTVRISQFAGASAPAGCTFNGKLDVFGNNTSNAQTWTRIHADGEDNFEFTLQGSELEIITPENHAAMPAVDALFESQATDDIVKVEYFAELYPLGSSTSPQQNFRLDYSFSNGGRRIITAKGYDAAGEFVAFDQIELRVVEGAFIIDGLRDGGVYPPTLSFKARVSKSALTARAMELGVPVSTLGVSCTADGFALPVEPSNVAGLMWSGNTGVFTVTHTFSQMGNRVIECQITHNGSAAMSTEAMTVSILEGASGLEFLAPQHRGWYKRDQGMEFLVRAHDPRIVRVDYVADGKWKFGDSENAAEFFPFRYTFTHYGTRRIVAQGFSEEGMKIAEEDIYITLTNALGVVPAGSATVITQQIPDTPSLTSPIATPNPSITTPTTSPNLNNRRSLACAILAHHDAGRIKLLNADADAKGTAYNNIKDTCDGGRASNSNRSHRGPIRVDLNMKVMQLVYDMPSSGFTYQINWFAGARHSSGSQHYIGQAVDTGGILTPSYLSLNSCSGGSQQGRANRWIWDYGVSNGSNQTLSQCGNVTSGPSGFGFLNHTTWSHSAWR